MVISKLFGDWGSSPLPSSSQAEKDARGRKLYNSPKAVFQFASSGNELAVRHSLVPPPLASIEHNGRSDSAPQDSNIWHRFQNAGAFSEKSMRDKDRLALISALAVLETELHDYQYNMGLLLLERKTWASECESLRIAAEKIEEKLRREDAVHFREMSEASSRDAMLRRALDAEKQCTADLHKGLQELEHEAMEFKLSGNKKLAQAQEALLQVEQKELLAKSNLHAAEALSAEINRKRAQTETKMQDIATRELALRMEKQAFTLKLEAHASEIVLEQQSLKEWQRTLQEGQDRLLHGEKLMNKRERVLNDKGECLLKAEKELSDKRRALEEQQAALQQGRQELEAQLTAERGREQSLVDRELNLVKKEQEMLIRQDQHSSKERAAQKHEEEVARIQQFIVHKKDQLQALQITTNQKKKEMARQAKELDLLRVKLEEEKTCLEDKRRRYEATALELQELHRHLEAEKEGLSKDRLVMEANIDELEGRSKTVEHREQEALKREGFLREREQHAELSILKTQKEEETLNRKQKNLAAERRNVEEEMKAARSDIQCMITEIEHEKQKILRQRQKLHQAEQIHLQLQSDINDLKEQREKAIDNVEGLRAERARYAKERNKLEVKAAKIRLETEAYQEERKSMSAWLQGEEERLNREKQESLDQFHREVEALLKDKEQLNKEIACQRSGMLSELQNQKQELETNLLSRQRELEWRLDKEREGIRMYYLEKESKLLKEVKQEKEQIRASRESVMRAMKAIKLERELLDKERLQILSKTNNDGTGHMPAFTNQEKNKEQALPDECIETDDRVEKMEDPIYIGECSVAPEGAGTCNTPASESTYSRSQQFQNVSNKGVPVLGIVLPGDKGSTTFEDAANKNGGKQSPKLDNYVATETDKQKDNQADDQAPYLSDHDRATQNCPIVESCTEDMPLRGFETADLNHVDNQHGDTAQEEAMDMNVNQYTKRKRRRSLVVQLS